MQPKAARKDIRESTQPKPTRKDILKSIQSKPTTNDIQKITPSKDVERENNNPVQSPEDSFNKAHNFITRFNSWRSGKLTLSDSYLYEKKFVTPMSTKEWIRLRDELKLSESEDQYPRYAFNSATSTLIIQCMPTPVHESIQFCFTSAIAIAEADLPYSARCICVTGQNMKGFEDQYSGSDKIADVAVQIKNTDDELETKLVVEIGFSEEYDGLVEDIRLWLEGMSSVSMCVLVNVTEEPRYQCPVDINMDEQKFKKLNFPDPWKLKPRDILLASPFGPATYKGFVWAGRISTAFLERWKRNDKTGKAKKYGRVIDLLTAHNIRFKRSDFLDTMEDRNISINCEAFRELLAMKIKEMAVYRCQAMLEDRAKIQGSVQDQDYTPS